MWTNTEDKILKELIQENGTDKWAWLARKLYEEMQALIDNN